MLNISLWVSSHPYLRVATIHWSTFSHARLGTSQFVFIIWLFDASKEDNAADLQWTTWRISSIGCRYTIMCYEYSGQTQKSLAPIMRAFRVIHTHTGGVWTERSRLSHAWLLLWALLVHRWASALMPQRQEVRYCVKLCVPLSYCREKKHRRFLTHSMGF